MFGCVVQSWSWQVCRQPLSSHNPDRVAAGKIGYDYCRNGKRNNVHVTWTVQEMITQQCLLMELAGGSEHSAMHCRIADVAERTV